MEKRMIQPPQVGDEVWYQELPDRGLSAGRVVEAGDSDCALIVEARGRRLRVERGWVVGINRAKLPA